MVSEVIENEEKKWINNQGIAKRKREHSELNVLSCI